MLQRLPSLGRIGPESNDRQFVDTYILDGLRAQQISETISLGGDAARGISSERWINNLEDLGQRVLQKDTKSTPAEKLNLCRLATSNGNSVLAGDIVCSMVRNDSSELDFGGIEVKGGTFGRFVLSERAFANVSISHSVFSEISFPVVSARNVSISNSLVTRVSGLSSQSALPKWITDLTADQYDSVATVSRIRRIGLSPAQEIFTVIVRKTFFQKGSGRKEEALLRGLGTVGTKALATKVVNLLLREGLLASFKGDEGPVYTPQRSHTQRMQAILDQLSSSKDPIWTELDNL